MKINDKEYKLEFNGEALYVFKETFKKDFLNIITEIDKINEDHTLILELLWTLIKTSGEDIEPYDEWIRHISPLKVINAKVVSEIIRIVNEDASTTVEVKKTEQ